MINKQLMLRITVILVFAFSSNVLSAETKWTLVLEHDSKGVATTGSKESLIKAVRSGSEVRVYWTGGWVEHLADANFLTVIKSEVFAQLDTIVGQKPTKEPPSVELRESEWTGLISTKGPYEAKWFVKE
jgi:hypothetical protein